MYRFHDEQDGVVTRRQLLDAGFDSDRVRNEVAARRWRVVSGVIVQHNGPLTRRQRLWLAVLAHATPAALTGRTALREAGLQQWDDSVIHVVIPQAGHARKMVGVRAIRSRTFSTNSVLRVVSPPRVGIARALVDAIADEANARVASGLAVAVVQQRLATPESLAQAVALHRTLPHKAAVAGCLNDCRDGPGSLAEIDITPLLRRAGLPPPVRQQMRIDASGKRRYLDIDCGTFAIEVDGPMHMSVGNWVSDRLRENDLVIEGVRILHFPSLLIRSDPDEVVRQLTRARLRFGTG